MFAAKGGKLGLVPSAPSGPKFQPRNPCSHGRGLHFNVSNGSCEALNVGCLSVLIGLSLFDAFRFALIRCHGGKVKFVEFFAFVCFDSNKGDATSGLWLQSSIAFPVHLTGNRRRFRQSHVHVKPANTIRFLDRGQSIEMDPLEKMRRGLLVH